jgi:hypothetical protein
MGIEYKTIKEKVEMLQSKLKGSFERGYNFLLFCFNWARKAKASLLNLPAVSCTSSLCCLACLYK